MQNDQMQMILGELAQIRRLTEEVTSLKATMAQLPMAASPVRPVPAAPSVPVEKPAPRPMRPPAERPAPARCPSTPDRISDVGNAKTAPVTGDVHAWLSQRVAQVQKEREGRWQKIVSFLAGTPK
jgi:hypothetical protein